MTQTKKVTLDPGDSQEVAFTFTPDVAKVHNVSVDGQVGSFEALTPLPPEPATLQGYVTDPDTRTPIEQALVEVIGTELSDHSNSYGWYRVTHIPPRTHNIRVSVAYYETKILSVTFTAGEIKELDISLVRTEVPPIPHLVILESIIVSPKQVTLDELVTIRCHIRDKRGWYAGMPQAKFDLLCTINGVELSQYVIVPLQGEIDVDFTFTPAELGLTYGTYTATVLDRYTSFEVVEVIALLLYEGVYHCPFCGTQLETKELLASHLIECAPWEEVLARFRRPTGYFRLYCPLCDRGMPSTETMSREDIVASFIEHVEANHLLICPAGDLDFTWPCKVEKVSRYHPDLRFIPLGEHLKEHIAAVPTIPAPQVLPLACDIEGNESIDMSSFPDLYSNVAYRVHCETPLAFEGPAYYLRYSEPSDDKATAGVYYCGQRIATRVSYPATPASGIKIIFPHLEGKTWDAYIDHVTYTNPKTGWLGTTSFKTIDQFTGFGATIKHWRNIDKDWLRAKGLQPAYGPHPIMLRIETSDERIIITYPYCTWLTGSAWIINIEEELASIEAKHRKELKILEKCREKLPKIYDKYAETTRSSYCYYSPDNDCLKKTSRKLLGRELRIWCDRVPHPTVPSRLLFQSHVDYTLDEVETAYNTKLANENASYNDTKSWLEGLRDEYERNWSDP